MLALKPDHFCVDHELKPGDPVRRMEDCHRFIRFTPDSVTILDKVFFSDKAMVTSIAKIIIGGQLRIRTGRFVSRASSRIDYSFYFATLTNRRRALVTVG